MREPIETAAELRTRAALEMQFSHGGWIGHYLLSLPTFHERDSIAPLTSVHPSPAARRHSLKYMTIAGALARIFAAEERSVNICK
jgi:hypothetical protein